MTTLIPTPSSTSRSRHAALQLGALVERCLRLFDAWQPAGRPQVRSRLDPNLVLDRVGDEVMLGLTLLQLLHTGTLDAPAETLHLQLEPSPNGGLDLRLSLHPVAPALSQAAAWQPDGLPRSVHALSLAVLRSMVEQQGGALTLDSEPDRDHRLHCDLPLPAAALAIREAAGVPPVPDAPLRVLLVEDHPVNAEMTTAMLQRSGDIEVVLATTGEEALKHALQQELDVVLMDMFLPDTDGVVVARRIARMLGSATPPMVALTANAYASDRELCFQAGMVDFLSKPIGLHELVAAVRRWGGWHRGQRHPPGSNFADTPPVTG